MYHILDDIKGPEDVKKLNDTQQKVLSREIRQFLLEALSKTGGHLASNLGVVELTIAIHSIYSSPTDKIVWDVGHQSYVHKILTGRQKQFTTLRQYKGLSGFPKINESPHDAFGTGHSSTSISTALGMAAARDMEGKDFSVVAVIGDGALTGGMAFEALNHAGHLETNLTVILNENEMSIAENVGSLSRYLSRIRTDPTYFKLKGDIENIIKKIPGIGHSVAKVAEKAKDSIKYFLVPSMFFEEMGFTYLGPVDGHNITILKDVLSRAKKLNGPVLIHVVTKKGKGYNPAVNNPDKYHGVSPFDVTTGEILKKRNKQTFSSAFGEVMVELAGENPKLVAITAAMASGTGLSEFARTYPGRFFDVGIAEQHAVTFAAGMARTDFRPVFAVYSTFLQRAYDQIIHDVCLQNLPVVLAVDRAGIVGEDGPTHHGIFDISYLRQIPNMQVLAPSDCQELKAMIRYAVECRCPVAVRYPRGEEEEKFIVCEEAVPIVKGTSEVLKEGNHMYILAVGNMVPRVCSVATRLNEEGIDAGVVNVRFIKPIDIKLIHKIADETDKLVVVEDNIVSGGFGSYLLEYLNQTNLSLKVKLLAFPDEFIPHGEVHNLYKKYGLDEQGIYRSLLEFARGGKAIG